MTYSIQETVEEIRWLRGRLSDPHLNPLLREGYEERLSWEYVVLRRWWAWKIIWFLVGVAAVKGLALLLLV